MEFNNFSAVLNSPKGHKQWNINNSNKILASEFRMGNLVLFFSFSKLSLSVLLVLGLVLGLVLILVLILV